MHLTPKRASAGAMSAMSHGTQMYELARIYGWVAEQTGISHGTHMT